MILMLSWICKIAICFLLLMIAIEDCKSRSVRILWFTLLAPILIGANIMCAKITIQDIAVNAILLLLQGVVIWAYLSVKHRTFYNPFIQYIGMGDVIFMGILCLVFIPVNYILFELTTLVAMLILAVFIFRNKTIPMAGIQALALLLVMVTEIISSHDITGKNYWFDKIMYTA